MPFGVVSEVGREMGVLNGVVIVEREGQNDLGVNFGRPIVTNEVFATRLFSNYFEDFKNLFCKRNDYAMNYGV